MALLTTIFTPDTLISDSRIKSCERPSLGLLRLLEYCLNHSLLDLKMVMTIGRKINMKRFYIFIPLFKNLFFKKLSSCRCRQSNFVLRTFPTNLNFAVAFFLEFSLGLTSGTDYLSDIVCKSVVVFGYEDFLVPFRGLIVTRSSESRVHLKELSDESLSLFHVLVLVSLFCSVNSLTFAVINWLWTRRP